MPARWVTLGLLALLGVVQAQLWLGAGSLPHVMGLRAQLAEQQAVNDAARARNERIAVEIGDLKEGLEMVEEKARAELGMLRPDEILVQLTKK
jgi:cell division protein FtsB